MLDRIYKYICIVRVCIIYNHKCIIYLYISMSILIPRCPYKYLHHSKSISISISTSFYFYLLHGICIYISASIHINLHQSTSIYINLHLSTSIYTYLYLHLHLYPHLYLYLHLYLHLYLYLHISTSIYIPTSISTSICIPTSISTCKSASVSASIYLTEVGKGTTMQPELSGHMVCNQFFNISQKLLIFWRTYYI